MAKTNAQATVRYVGPVDYASGTFVGLEFDPPEVDGPVYGKHSGIVRGGSISIVPRAWASWSSRRKSSPRICLL